MAKAQYYTLQESPIRVCGPMEDPQVRLCCVIVLTANSGL